MRTRISLLTGICLALVAPILALAGAGESAPQRTEAGALPKLPPGTTAPVVLPIDPPRVTPVGRVGEGRDGKEAEIRVPGTVRPASEVGVGAMVSGQVTEVLVDAGDVVKTGQVLARLDRTRAELTLKRAEARLERMKAALNQTEAGVMLRAGEVKKTEAGVRQAEAQRDYTKKKLERMRELLKSNAVEQAVVDEAESHFRAAEAQVEQARAALHAAQSALDVEKASVMVARAEVIVAQADRELAKWAVEAAEIRAPSAGTVLARLVRVGDGVGPAPASGRPSPLFELADLTQLDVAANVPQKNLVGLKVGQKCEVRLDATPGVVYAGKVSRISPVVSRQDRTAIVRVKIDFPKDGPRLLPGMFGEVRILGKE